MKLFFKQKKHPGSIASPRVKKKKLLNRTSSKFKTFVLQNTMCKRMKDKLKTGGGNICKLKKS